MREFRTWCKNKEQWETDLIAILASGALLHGDVTINGSSKRKPCNHKTHIVEFYTGLLDKNGKKIFESDRVRYSNSIENGFGIVTTFGKCNNLGIEWESQNTESPSIFTPLFYLQCEEELEIIGNIHE